MADGERPPEGARPEEALIVDVDGFEGPLDLLLALARTQKVDLRRISVLDLAEQYLAFIARAKALRLELAADYLVMAAWLAFLKSHLLLPPDPAAEEPAEDVAARLAFQLQRLQAMREAAARLMALPQKGVDVFPRGMVAPEGPGVRTVWIATLSDLTRAYARLRTRDEFRPFVFDRRDVFTMEEALERLAALLGEMPGWTELSRWLPEDWCADPARRRSATAATFAASLEMARQGRLELAQEAAFAPLRLKGRGR